MSCPVALARIFVMKIGVLPERVLTPLLNDRMVAKGTILAFVTDFFVDFLATGSVDDLVRGASSAQGLSVTQPLHCMLAHGDLLPKTANTVARKRWHMIVQAQ